jgi:hypothetical protein
MQTSNKKQYLACQIGTKAQINAGIECCVIHINLEVVCFLESKLELTGIM